MQHGIGAPPLARWRQGVAEHGPPPAVPDAGAFLVDFPPIVRRRILREGFVVDHIAYFCDALRPWIAGRSELARFVIRRDPRDLSRVWALDPQDRAYIEVPCSRRERPRITLFEHRQATARLRAEGRAQVDEDAIFRAVAAQRELAQAAAGKTRQAAPPACEGRARAGGSAAEAGAGEAIVADEGEVWDAEPFPMERWR